MCWNSFFLLTVLTISPPQINGYIYHTVEIYTPRAIPDDSIPDNNNFSRRIYLSNQTIYIFRGQLNKSTLRWPKPLRILQTNRKGRYTVRLVPGAYTFVTFLKFNLVYYKFIFYVNVAKNRTRYDFELYRPNQNI